MHVALQNSPYTLADGKGLLKNPILLSTFTLTLWVPQASLHPVCYTDPLGGVDPLTSDNTPSSDPKPDPL